MLLHACVTVAMFTFMRVLHLPAEGVCVLVSQPLIAKLLFFICYLVLLGDGQNGPVFRVVFSFKG